jgi:hypothetical protein
MKYTTINEKSTGEIHVEKQGSKQDIIFGLEIR